MSLPSVFTFHACLFSLAIALSLSLCLSSRTHTHAAQVRDSCRDNKHLRYSFRQSEKGWGIIPEIGYVKREEIKWNCENK